MAEDRDLMTGGAKLCAVHRPDHARPDDMHFHDGPPFPAAAPDEATSLTMFTNLGRAVGSPPWPKVTLSGQESDSGRPLGARDPGCLLLAPSLVRAREPPTGRSEGL